MKRKTNVEFITDLMEFSNQGSLMQLFVMTAIEKYAEACEKERLPEDGIINPDAWHRCAKELLVKLEDQYGS